MKIQDACLPCITAQAVSCAALIPEADRPAFYHSVFHTLAQLDFNQPVVQGLLGLNYIFMGGQQQAVLFTGL